MTPPAPISSVVTRRLVAALTQPTEECRHHHITTHDGRDFGNAFVLPAGYPQAGQWVFNRGSVPIALDWEEPEPYYHPTLEALMAHVEATCPPFPCTKTS